MTRKGTAFTDGKRGAKIRNQEIIQAQLRGETVRAGEGDKEKK